MSPTHFLALQVSQSASAVRALERVQRYLVEHTPALRDAVVDPASAHLTLCVAALREADEVMHNLPNLHMNSLTMALLGQYNCKFCPYCQVSRAAAALDTLVERQLEAPVIQLESLHTFRDQVKHRALPCWHCMASYPRLACC